MDVEKWSVGDDESSLLKFIPNAQYFVCNGREETETLCSLSLRYLVGRDDSCVV